MYPGFWKKSESFQINYSLEEKCVYKCYLHYTCQTVVYNTFFVSQWTFWVVWMNLPSAEWVEILSSASSLNPTQRTGYSCIWHTLVSWNEKSLKHWTESGFIWPYWGLKLWSKVKNQSCQELVQLVSASAASTPSLFYTVVTLCSSFKCVNIIFLPIQKNLYIRETKMQVL